MAKNKQQDKDLAAQGDGVNSLTGFPDLFPDDEAADTEKVEMHKPPGLPDSFDDLLDDADLGNESLAQTGGDGGAYVGANPPQRGLADELLQRAGARPGGPGRGMMLITLASLLATAAMSAIALWFGLGAAGRLDELQQRMAQLQQQAAKLSSSGDGAQLQAEVRQLGARLTELAVIVEGPVSHLRQSNEEALAALAQRIDSLEQGLAVSATDTLIVTHNPPAGATAPAGETPRATAGSADGWVINLASLRNEQDAQEEMSRLRKAGVRVEIQQAVADGKTWYRLRVPGFASYAGARAYVETVEKQAGVRNAWVAKE